MENGKPTYLYLTSQGGEFMTASPFVPISRPSQEAFLEYYKAVQDYNKTTRQEKSEKFERLDKLYQRETDLTLEQQRAKTANRSGDPTRHQNVVVPVVMPQVESAVTYQTSVFLTGEPIFGVIASPTYIDEALQLESILEEQSLKGGWAKELILFFRDGFKHNFAPLEVSWEKEVTQAIDTDLTVESKKGVTKEVIWEGNRIKSLDVYLV